MKSITAIVLVAALAFGVGAVYADSHERMVMIWKCQLNDGKTMDDVQAANGKWVKHVNAAIDEGEIRSYVLSTVVGDQGTFLYIDSFPDGMAWLAEREAMQTDAGQALEAELNDVANCSHSSLYESEQSMPAD